MPQIINTNIASLNAQRNLDRSQSDNQTALQRLSSGLRINSAKDDAAGLAISTRFTSQIKGLNVAVRNAGDGIALAQTAEGALGTINENLQRIRELAVQSSNATNSDVDREALQAEVEQLVAEITRTSEETDFNGRNLLDGSFSATFQIGANAGQTVDISIAQLTSDKLGASDSAGISAIGTDSALSNGDLVINGVDVKASRAEDDTASVANNAASAIAKAAAINQVSEETGVRAQVNENTVAGTAQKGVANGSGTFSLNNVEISFSTSADTAQTRASVAEAINAVSEQTGVRAVAGKTDSEGVSLVAEDGRNITLNFDTADLTNISASTFASATGLAGGQTQVGSTTEYTNTYEGGYTLIADGDVKEIEITGGNGAGRGDLANAGLVKGSYSSSTAALVSEKSTVSAEGAGFKLDGSLTNTIGAADALEISGTYTVSVEIDGTTYATTTTDDDTLGNIATDINSAVGTAGATAYEEINATLDFTDVSADDFDIEAAASVTIDIVATDDNESIVDKINAADFSGADLEVSASLNSDGKIDLKIKNFSDNTVSMEGTANTVADVTVGSTTLAVDDTAADLQGDLKILGTDGKEVSATITSAAGTTTSELFASGPGKSVTDSGVNGLDAGDLTINGVGIGAAVESADTASADKSSNGDTIISSDKSRSAIAIAEAINEVSEETGVEATVNETVVVGGDGSNVDKSTFAIGDSAELYINGVAIGAVTLQSDGTGSTSSSIDTDKAKSDTIAAINAKSSQTGVTAIDNGVSVTLTAADGRNVSVAIDNNSATGTNNGFGALLGLDSSVEGIGEAKFDEVQAARGFTAEAEAEAVVYETTYGSVKLESAKEITIQAGSKSAAELESLGFSTGTFGGGEDGQFLKDIDISTFEGAQAAITAVDNAIGQVANQRADLGAIQNRLESTVSNLQVTSENLNSANSRIRDADFAAETAELSRTQVLQQAGISILAQANAAGQQVLSLLG